MSTTLFFWFLKENKQDVHKKAGFQKKTGLM